LQNNDPAPTTVSRLLAQLRDGNDAAVDELFTLVYEELQRLAHRQRRGWRDLSTLDTTALVHEAYLKLVGRLGPDLKSRAHFLALASRAMRHILCNYARDRRALKRGGGREALPLTEGAALPAQGSPAPEAAETLVFLDRALQRLERHDPRRSKVVECRFFGGLSVEDTALALGISPRTVKRDWAVAQAWLYREMVAET
jgi:RNA polymerase sigma factor (TIGR02999 family)